MYTMCDMPHLHVSFAKEPYKKDYILQKRPHVYLVWHDCYIIHITCDMTSICDCVTWQIHVGHTHVWHDSLIRICDVCALTQPNMLNEWHDSSYLVMCAVMNHSLLCVTRLVYSYVCYEWHGTLQFAMCLVITYLRICQIWGICMT